MKYKHTRMIRNYDDFLFDIRIKVGIQEFWGINLYPIFSWCVLPDENRTIGF